MLSDAHVGDTSLFFRNRAAAAPLDFIPHSHRPPVSFTPRTGKNDGKHVLNEYTSWPRESWTIRHVCVYAVSVPRNGSADARFLLALWSQMDPTDFRQRR